ncbi:MAG TPA: glycosyltransferase family 4 protein [Gaiellaceae bacterium]|nr:glycosyltransferase family 4 protein [Gaiellaceae bacterium]
MKVVVLTTSYPRWKGDAAGRFVGDAVGHLRERGVGVAVVSPRDFPHFGIAYGSGVVGNLRAAPWKALLLPVLLLSFVRAARRAAVGADVVHAHWLPLAAVGLATGKPVVVQLWGTDVELARRAPLLARALLRRVRLVVCASSTLADAARELGARQVRVIPSGVGIPERVGEEDEPPFVLYAGRLSPEKGVTELVTAADGMPLVVAGDGPLRDRVPGALGFLPRHDLEPLYERCAVVACPSYREGFGVACAEAMAHGKPVVASAVGGLRDLVVDGETGLLVPPGDVDALRGALRRLLDDRELRRRLGEAGRRRATERLSWDGVVAALTAAYREALA